MQFVKQQLQQQLQRLIIELVSQLLQQLKFQEMPLDQNPDRLIFKQLKNNYRTL